MRAAIALTTTLGILAFGCGETKTEDSGAVGSGGTQVATGNTAAKGGAGVTSKTTASGGSTERTSARDSAAPAGGSGTTRTTRATGGKSAAGGKAAGGTTSAESGGPGGDAGDAGADVGGQSTGGKSSAGGKSARGGSNAGGQSAGGKSAGGGSNAGGQSTGGTTSASTASSTGGQAAGGDDSGKSAGCGKEPGIASGQYNKGQPISITVGGKQRRYILNVPTNYDKSKPYRLIVVYHQLDGNDKQMFNWKYYGLLPLSNDSTIFVAPNGQKNGSPCSGTGDGDSGCGWPNSSDSDLALADAVVAQTEENFCIDKTRIFATGWSYGGSMSYRTACSRPLDGGSAAWGVRGIAIYAAAQLSGSCTPSKPVAFYHAHGTRDSVLNYDNMGLPLAKNFASANGCTWATPAKVSSGAHVCTNLTGCKEGYPLEFCSFNGDHTPFPDNGQAEGSWGPQEAWKFLSQF